MFKKEGQGVTHATRAGECRFWAITPTHCQWPSRTRGASIRTSNYLFSLADRRAGRGRKAGNRDLRGWRLPMPKNGGGGGGGFQTRARATGGGRAGRRTTATVLFGRPDQQHVRESDRRRGGGAGKKVLGGQRKAGGFTMGISRLSAIQTRRCDFCEDRQLVRQTDRHTPRDHLDLSSQTFVVTSPARTIVYHFIIVICMYSVIVKIADICGSPVPLPWQTF